MQEPTAEVQHTGQEHPTRPRHRTAAEIFRQAEKWLSPSWPLHHCSIPGLPVAMCPGTASMTHGKPRQHELAEVHTSLHWFYVFTCDIRQHRQMQNKTAWYGTKLICQLLLDSSNWQSGFMPEEQFASLFNPAFEHVRGYLKPVWLYGQSKKKLWPSYLTCYSHAGVTLDLWVCVTRMICFVLLPWALLCLSQLTKSLQVFPCNTHFLASVCYNYMNENKLYN